MLYNFQLAIIFNQQMSSSLKLTTLTVIGRQEQKKLSQILTYLIDLPDAAEFIHPVDWQELDLVDYPQIVKNPMNLLKVQEKLKNRQYRAVEEVLDHIQLVWDNCKAYNPQGTYYVLSDKMERAYKKMIRNYLPNIQVVVPKPIGSNSLPSSVISEKPPQAQIKPVSKPSRTSHTGTHVVQSKEASYEEGPSINERQQESEPDEIPHNEKNRFHQRLKQLTQQELAQIIFIIQENCAGGFKELGNGRGQIHLDSIDAQTFRKLNAKVDDLLEGQKIIGSKKIKI